MLMLIRIRCIHNAVLTCSIFSAYLTLPFHKISASLLLLSRPGHPPTHHIVRFLSESWVWIFCWLHLSFHFIFADICTHVNRMPLKNINIQRPFNINVLRNPFDVHIFSDAFIHGVMDFVIVAGNHIGIWPPKISTKYDFMYTAKEMAVFGHFSLPFEHTFYIDLYRLFVAWNVYVKMKSNAVKWKEKRETNKTKSTENTWNICSSSRRAIQLEFNYPF